MEISSGRGGERQEKKRKEGEKWLGQGRVSGKRKNDKEKKRINRNLTRVNEKNTERKGKGGMRREKEKRE